MTSPRFAFIKKIIKRDQHVFVVMTACGMDVFLYELHFLGWREVASVNVPLDSLSDGLTSVEAGLLHAIKGWGVQTGANISWVLPPDIVGVVRNQAGVGENTNLDSVFPFSRNDFLVSRALNGRDFNNTILWIHKDWADAFKRVSVAVDLHCCEFFARPQLFSQSLINSEGAVSVVVDEVQGGLYLHIFNIKCELVRSLSIGSVEAASIEAIVGREIAAMESVKTKIYRVGPKIFGDADVMTPSLCLSSVELSAKNSAEYLRDLAKSLEQGIELGPAHHGVAKTIARSTILASTIVLAGFAFILWHGYYLKAEIVQERTSIRRDLVFYEDVKKLRSDDVRYANVVDLKRQFSSQPESFKALASVLGSMGPASSLQYFSQKGLQILIAARKEPNKNNIISFQNTDNYLELREVDPREVNESPSATFARQFIWRDPSMGIFTSPSGVNTP